LDRLYAVFFYIIWSNC